MIEQPAGAARGRNLRDAILKKEQVHDDDNDVCGGGGGGGGCGGGGGSYPAKTHLDKFPPKSNDQA